MTGNSKGMLGKRKVKKDHTAKVRGYKIEESPARDFGITRQSLGFGKEREGEN